MRKSSRGRLPHGSTLTIVQSAVIRLHHERGRSRPVSRTDLIGALPQLPETMIDNRLHELVRQRGLVKAGRGLYLPPATSSIEAARHQPDKPAPAAEKSVHPLDSPPSTQRPPPEVVMKRFEQAGYIRFVCWLPVEDYDGGQYSRLKDALRPRKERK